MLTIQDENLLRVLQRALYEVKFERSPDDALELSGSPFLADVYGRVVAACIRTAEAHGKLRDARELQEWLCAETHEKELGIVRTQIELSGRWKRMSPDQRRTYTEHLLSPFVAQEHTLLALVEHGNRFHGVDGGPVPGESK